MKIFTAKKFTGYWPVGTAAVIVARNVKEAVMLLEEELKKRGLSQKISPDSLVELNLNKETVVILRDGNY